jgi:uncharacterized protein HemX
MAIIGARPAQPWYLGWREPRRPRAAVRVRRASHSTRTARAAAHRVRTRRTTRRDVRPLLLVIALAAGLALFYLSQSTHVAATGYRIDDLEARLSEQRAMQQQLLTAIGQARSPAEITARAKRELGLVPLDESAVTFVEGAATEIVPPHWAAIDH